VARLAIALLVLLAACASPVPRADRLGALEQRMSAQRARSASVERALAGIPLGAVAPPAPSGPVPYYELVTFRTSEPLDARYDPELRAQLAHALAQSGAAALEYRDPAGAVRSFAPPWPGHAFDGVSRAALFAAGYAAAPQFRGAELDVRVPLEPGPDRRVTAIHELDGRVLAQEALAEEPPAPDAPTPEALRARYGIGPVEGWSAVERASLDQALALLRPEERALLAGLPFLRKGRGAVLAIAGARSRHCGHFELEADQRAIYVYDCAFDTDRHAFVGPLDRPLAPSVRIVLHEIAHALSAAHLGNVLADLTTSQREARAMVEEFNALGRRVPPQEVERVERLQTDIQALQADLGRWHEKIQGADYLGTSAVQAFLEIPGASSGFTSYGRTSPVEAFAEAFSLCRTDPEAARRISAAVCDFFESGAYLEAGR
jgi:hypothetical protein